MSGVTLALVSGANRGIGLEVARELARDGHRVLAGTRSLDAMGDMDGLDITPVELDVTDPESIAALPLGDLEVLVNNAGVYPPGRASQIDFDVADETWRTNALGAWRLAVAAMNAITRVLAADLRSKRILVNSVCPGWAPTDMGGAGATRSVQEGAASVLWAARLGPDGPTGGFFRDGRPVPW
jgi:NAD(P)-dependent dehydrogenase (short-subunit alcohol dehydrogenase family)